jgi:hypothetical protein
MDIQYEIETELTAVLESLSHGSVCPLDTVLYYRQKMEVYERLKKTIEFLDQVETALRKFGKDKHGLISITYRRNFNYESCGDSTLATLEVAQKEMDAKVKARKECLRAMTLPFFDEDGTQVLLPTSVTKRQIEISINKTKF